MDVAALATTIDDLVEVDPASLGDAGSVLGLLRQFQRLEAVVTRAVGAFDDSRAWAPSGAQTATAWLTAESRLPRRRCADLVGRAARLSDLPHTEAAWLAGDLGADHVDRIRAVRNERTREAHTRDESVLVGTATRFRFTTFLGALRHWEQLADPDGTDEAAERRRNRRDAWLVQGYGGTWEGRLHLDPIAGTVVAEELHRIEQSLFEADWAEAEGRLGRAPGVGELARTGAQRRADAFVAMATRSAACPEGARRPAPLFTVFVGYETFHGRLCELANGTVVTPGSLLRYLEDADIERAVFGGDGRVEIGPTQRFFTGATRRALELRDRECAHSHCEQRFDRCQADHIVEYSQGGPTTQENGRMLCSFHNRLRNQRRRE